MLKQKTGKTNPEVSALEAPGFQLLKTNPQTSRFADPPNVRAMSERPSALGALSLAERLRRLGAELEVEAWKWEENVFFLGRKRFFLGSNREG